MSTQEEYRKMVRKLLPKAVQRKSKKAGLYYIFSHSSNDIPLATTDRGILFAWRLAALRLGLTTD